MNLYDFFQNLSSSPSVTTIKYRYNLTLDYDYLNIFSNNRNGKYNFGYIWNEEKTLNECLKFLTITHA